MRRQEVASEGSKLQCNKKQASIHPSFPYAINSLFLSRSRIALVRDKLQHTPIQRMSSPPLLLAHESQEGPA